MATIRDKQLVATRWYGRPSPGELFVNPKGDEATIRQMAQAMYAARLVYAARMSTFLFILLTLFAFATLGVMGLWAFTGTAVFAIMWVVARKRYKSLTAGIKVGDLNGGDVDDTIGFSRLNVALDDAVRGEEAGTVDETQRARIADVLVTLPDRFDFKHAARASEEVWSVLRAQPAVAED